MNAFQTIERMTGATTDADQRTKTALENIGYSVQEIQLIQDAPAWVPSVDRPKISRFSVYRDSKLLAQYLVESWHAWEVAAADALATRGEMLPAPYNGGGLKALDALWPALRP